MDEVYVLNINTGDITAITDEEYRAGPNDYESNLYMGIEDLGHWYAAGRALRESGITDMHGAVDWLEENYDRMTREFATAIFNSWKLQEEIIAKRHKTLGGE